MAIIEISKISVPGSNPGAPANNIFYRETERLKKHEILVSCFLFTVSDDCFATLLLALFIVNLC